MDHGKEVEKIFNIYKHPNNKHNNLNNRPTMMKIEGVIL